MGLFCHHSPKGFDGEMGSSGEKLGEPNFGRLEMNSDSFLSSSSFFFRSINVVAIVDLLIKQNLQRNSTQPIFSPDFAVHTAPPPA